ncbi:MAG: hypothetical protein A3F84_17355 [Candidatus Handelsmanbacteria bacterium RIFCSPLOWO2_12_FULL_64_10]|uniref:HTH luxR-type domain-containing protein n=1 Tax=Handelsmanbacteria sp. (strain RIFCSPLOWO2_12_FULL_64_10) TaxID=1817868 RepID=A0A1F6C9Z5_HANXR|nr:MAG: hypothetical protein A3F84_17355 [Candidatus Handelsmanbacteria bacterium RIFCSPLOWO2_12_FULL_64_10]
MRTEDGELVRQTLTGDQAAFAELVNRYRDAACGVAYHYLGGFDDAQDAVQEAFVHTYLHLNQLSDPGKFAPWLRRITANACADLLRRRGDRLVSLDEEEARAMSGSEQDPERLAARRVVRQALERLSEKTRLAVTLFYIDGYSQEEVAGFLEVPVNTVRSRLRRAKQKLREEMMDMVTDVLTEGKPDPQFTRRVVEEALRRAEESRKAHAAGDALRHYDEALEAVEKLPPDAEQQRLKMDVLYRKGAASWFPRGKEEVIKHYEQALAIAEALGDRQNQAIKLSGLGHAYASYNRQKAEEYYQKALKTYQELGDAQGQANCLKALGGQHFFAKEVAPGKRYIEQALPLFEEASSQEWVAVCRGILNLAAEVGEERFPKLIAWSGWCDVLEQQGDTVSFVSQPGFGWCERKEIPATLDINSVFYQVSSLNKFLDASVPIGGGWSGDAFSYSYQPLRATVTVKSASERVTVPAGTFERCLLTEHVTTESDLPDDAPEREKQLNRKVRCGTRRAWYAPGVGLVQLHVQQAEGAEAMIQLREFSVQGEGDDYLPLSIDNSWTYGWADILPEYVAKEVYRVAANVGDTWYLENWRYCMWEEVS